MFRDEQCQRTAKKMQGISSQVVATNSTPQWRAYYSQDPRKRCILLCKLDDKPNFVMFNHKVTDGTKCGLNSDDICVNGHCLVSRNSILFIMKVSKISECLIFHDFCSSLAVVITFCTQKNRATTAEFATERTTRATDNLKRCEKWPSSATIPC
jgi:hypothetical protein